MWRKDKYDLDLIDSKIVTRDFIMAEGNALSYISPNKERISLDRGIYSPILYLFKVHKNHPIRIVHEGLNYSNIWPANDNKKSKKNFRMPGEIIRDKMDYDLTTFRILPFDINFEENFKAWEKFSINEGFTQEKGSSTTDIIQEVKQNISLLYCPHGASINSSDYLHRVSEIMPSQVVKHFYKWFTEEKEIISYDKSLNNKRLEGKVSVSPEIARGVTANIFNKLEDRYNTRLLFERYKEEFPDIFDIN